MADRASAAATNHPFSPWLGSPESLLRTLVSRRAVLEELLQGLHDTQQGGSANHVLLVGPRGIGKTHLLSLVDHQVLNDLMENPTAENVVLWAWERLKGKLSGLRELRLWETPAPRSAMWCACAPT